MTMQDREHRIAIVRQAYAKQILAGAGVSDALIERAFAHVPRERHLGPGPWQRCRGISDYTATPDDDPVHLYTDALFAIRARDHINNGQPSLHASLMASASINPGEHVVHFGAGCGYFSAIMAHIVGPAGKVTAIEYDKEIANRARRYLESTRNVRVVHADGFTYPIDPADVIYVSGGVSHIGTPWLDALRDGGRIILPMSLRAEFKRLTPGPLDLAALLRLAQSGALFRIVRAGGEFHVKSIGSAAFIPAEGTNDAAEAALGAALQKGTAANVTRLYREQVPDERCWLRGDGWCLAYR